MSQRRVILFDLDGVLVDSAASVELAWSGWAQRRRLDPAVVLGVAHGRRTLDTIRAVAPHLAAVAEAHELERLAISQTRDEQAMPGAASLISKLGDDDWAVVTSGTKALATARLQAAGLPLPRVLVTAEDVAAGKPDPQCYLLAAGLLNASREDCIVIEDSPAGVAAARAAGMRAIAITSTHAASELDAADLVVRDLAAVRAALERS